MLSADIVKDVNRLKAVLRYAQKLLSWLVSDGITSSPEQQALASTRGEMDAAVNTCVTTLSSISNDDDTMVGQLRTVGLIGPMANAKLTVGATVASSGFLGRILKWLNSFLGSLAVVIPAADLISEYKDNTELVMEHQQDNPPIPNDILGLKF